MAKNQKGVTEYSTTPFYFSYYSQFKTPNNDTDSQSYGTPSKHIS